MEWRNEGAGSRLGGKEESSDRTNAAPETKVLRAKVTCGEKAVSGFKKQEVLNKEHSVEVKVSQVQQGLVQRHGGPQTERGQAGLHPSLQICLQSQELLPHSILFWSHNRMLSWWGIMNHLCHSSSPYYRSPSCLSCREKEWRIIEYFFWSPRCFFVVFMCQRFLHSSWIESYWDDSCSLLNSRDFQALFLHWGIVNIQHIQGQLFSDQVKMLLITKACEVRR